ncbi:MAG: L-dopachrome tautomerase-related protein [Planctomycetota bacterium]
MPLFTARSSSTRIGRAMLGFVAATLALAPTLGGCAASGAGERKARGFDILARIDEAPGNITVTPRGKIIVSLHQFYEPTWRVAEVDRESGVLRPFPNPEWAEELGADNIGLDSVLGIVTDDKGVVWMLDNGRRGGSTPRLVGWNTRKNELEKSVSIFFPGVESSFLNDLVLDPNTQHVYIANSGGPGEPSLVVLDLRTGLARPVLAGDAVVSAERDAKLVFNGKTLTQDGPNGPEPREVGINPITIDADGRYVYFGAMTGKSIYRVRTSDLRNTDLSDNALAARVEPYAGKPVSDGMTIDSRGNLYIADLENGGIGIVPARGRTYEPIFSNPSLVEWPDGLSGGPDGLIYATVNQLHHSPVLNDGRDASVPPYLIIRVNPKAKPMVGR